MDKQTDTSQKVRPKIIKALLTLLETKNFSEISVTDLVREAGVARQSYYRNFRSKEEIIEAFFLNLQSDVLRAFQENHITDYGQQCAIVILRVLLQNRSAILCLHRAGFSLHNQNLINARVEYAAGDMPSNSVERYQLYCYAGAIYNAAFVWLENGAVEPPEDIAKVICSFSIPDFMRRIRIEDIAEQGIF